MGLEQKLAMSMVNGSQSASSVKWSASDNIGVVSIRFLKNKNINRITRTMNLVEVQT